MYSKGNRSLGTVEKTIEKSFGLVKPYISVVARFLLVSTFLEDSLRILMQYDDQKNFLVAYRKFPQALSDTFLLGNVIIMCICSSMAIFKIRTFLACLGLMAVIVCQALGYGLMFNFSFMLRNASLIGAVLMLMSESMNPDVKKTLFPGLPAISSKTKAQYVLLMGRIMLICLFLSLSFAGELTPLRLVFAALSLVSSILVIIGFKAKYSAIMLLALLSVSNVLLNNFWTLSEYHPNRDYLKYDFFQTLSVIGGLLLLVNVGPGGVSIDAKKKEF